METGKFNASHAAALAAFKKPDKPSNAKNPSNNNLLRGNSVGQTISTPTHPNAASTTSLTSNSLAVAHHGTNGAKYPATSAKQQVRNIYLTLLNTPKSSTTDLSNKRAPSKMATSAGIAAANARSEQQLRVNNNIDTQDLTLASTSSSSMLSGTSAAITAARTLHSHHQTPFSSDNENGESHHHLSDKVHSSSSSSFSLRIANRQSTAGPSGKRTAITAPKHTTTNKSQIQVTGSGTNEVPAQGKMASSSTSHSPMASSSEVCSISLSNPSLAVVGRLDLVKSQAKAKENIKQLKISIDSKITSRDHEHSRIPGGYAPLEMIKNVRDAISSRMVSNPTAVQPSEENNAMIQSIRDSINLRRLSHMSQSDSHLPYRLHERISPLCSPDSAKLTTEGHDYFSILKTTSNLAPEFANFDLSNGGRTSIDNIKDLKATAHSPLLEEKKESNLLSYGHDYFTSNRSIAESLSGSGGMQSPISVSENQSVCESAFEEVNEELLSVPASHFTCSDSGLESRSFGGSGGNNSKAIFQHGNGSRLVSSDFLQSPCLGVGGKAIRASSFASSLSLSSSFKNLDFDEPGTLIAPNIKSPLSTLANQEIKGNGEGSNSGKSRPKRKAPPQLLSPELPPTTISPKLSNKSNSSLGNTSGLEDQTAFPRFPEIFKRGKADPQTLLFGKKKASKQQKGVYYDINLLDDDHESLSSEILPTSTTTGTTGPTTPTVTPTTPRGVSNPIRLKTTMRDHKKNRRDTFNENKPWKHHSDLNFLSESERKRYEGVWMSNKGLYIKSVVTKLVGVDYEDNNEDDNKKSTIECTTSDQSLVAARLSANHKTADLKASDAQFHNLESVQPNELIHGIVIKRIWKRCRLPDSTLETIWNLVDFRKDGTLNKPEFLVGMWLIDQCLYGRKLPKKVDNKVWESLGSIGVTLRKRKR